MSQVDVRLELLQSHTELDVDEQEPEEHSRQADAFL